MLTKWLKRKALEIIILKIIKALPDLTSQALEYIKNNESSLVKNICDQVENLVQKQVTKEVSKTK